MKITKAMLKEAAEGANRDQRKLMRKYEKMLKAKNLCCQCHKPLKQLQELDHKYYLCVGELLYFCENPACPNFALTQVNI